MDYGCLPRFKHDFLPRRKLYGGAGEGRLASELWSSKDDFKVVFFFPFGLKLLYRFMGKTASAGRYIYSDRSSRLENCEKSD